MSVFPAKIARKFSPVQTFFCHLPQFNISAYICKLAALRLVIHHHMDCDWQISVLNVSFNNYFIATLLCLSLKNPPCSCHDHVIFSTLSFAIVPSYFYLSPITAAVKTELSRHDSLFSDFEPNTNREQTNR